MFLNENNIVVKIQLAAQIFNIVSILGFICSAIQIFNGIIYADEDYIFTGILAAIITAFVMMFSLMLYGFGQIIENTANYKD
jgi:hypothetical protein